MNETRTTRIIALMAGNGFFVSQLGQHWLEHGRTLQVPAIITAIVAIVGLSSAYLSLFWGADQKLPAWCEGFAALCFLADVAWYLHLSASGY
jgi:hypothetical protein